MLKFLERRWQSGWVPGMVGSILGLAWGWGAWQPVEGLNLGSVDIRPEWESAWVRAAIASDPAADSLVSGYLGGLSTNGYLTNDQGVWVAAGPYTVAQHQGSVRRPAASLTKIATSLAALSTWGPEYRFETLVGWQGQLENGVVIGDLVIEGGYDPLFVWEEAIALGNTLQQMGIRQVTGNLVIAGGFTMNFDISPSASGQMLKQAMNAAAWDYAAQSAYESMAPGTPQPQIQIDGEVVSDPGSAKNRVSGWLVRHHSMPLVAVLKAMNIYSNNAMAEQIASSLGGPAAVVRQVETATGLPAAELSLINGSGLGEGNQMSPRAAVVMLQQMQDELRSQGFTLSDIFPVVGADGGTVTDRNIPNNAVVKTGTLAVVSALAGALPTQQKGIVWFSILNYGSDLNDLRSRQDQVVSAIEQQWGKATEIPPELKTTVTIGQAPYQLGDPQRNQPIYSN